MSIPGVLLAHLHENPVQTPRGHWPLSPTLDTVQGSDCLETPGRHHCTWLHDHLLAISYRPFHTCVAIWGDTNEGGGKVRPNESHRLTQAQVSECAFVHAMPSSLGMGTSFARRSSTSQPPSRKDGGPEEPAGHFCSMCWEQTWCMMLPPVSPGTHVWSRTGNTAMLTVSGLRRVRAGLLHTYLSRCSWGTWRTIKAWKSWQSSISRETTLAFRAW